MEERISGHTGLLALIGSPVGHSGSPAMYNYSFAKLGLDYAYVAFDIKEDQVKDDSDGTFNPLCARCFSHDYSFLFI